MSGKRSTYTPVWKVSVAKLHALKGAGTAEDIDTWTTESMSSVITRLRNYGLIEFCGKTKKREKKWKLTEKGRQYCEGKLIFVHNGPTKKAHFQATWLLSLPPPIYGDASKQMELRF
jgi:hypothetical protein